MWEDLTSIGLEVSEPMGWAVVQLEGGQGEQLVRAGLGGVEW